MNVARTVIVRNLAVPLSIGIHAHERLAPQRVLVSVEARLADAADGQAAGPDTLDYDLICDFIRSLGGLGHIELQETVAEMVLKFTLGLPGVASAIVETRKPDAFEDCEYVGVRLSASL